MTGQVTKSPSHAFFLYGLPLALYLAVIFTLSSQPHLHAPIEFTNSDKLYHMSEYGGLGLLLARTLRAFLPGRPLANRVWIAIALGAVIATCDELWQMHVPGRESSGYDAMADVIGVSLAQWLYARWIARRAGAR